MRIYGIVALMGMLLFAGNVFSQATQQSGWFLSMNTIKLNKKWGVHAELQLRSTNHWEQVQNILLRGGINYSASKNTVLTAGYALIPTRTAASGYTDLLPEHRIWQQLVINQPVKNTVLSHRFRLEERFVATGQLDGTDVKTADRLYSTRLRYFIRAVIPLNNQQPFTKGIFLGLQEEVFANITDRQNVNGYFFDQNRAYVALGYRVSKKLDLEAGYMNQYLQRRKGVDNLMNHIVQLAVYTRL